MTKKNKTIIIQTKPAGPDGIQLVLPELEAMYKAYEGYYTKHYRDGATVLFDSTVALYQWFDKYAEDVFQGKQYSLEHLVGALFDNPKRTEGFKIKNNDDPRYHYLHFNEESQMPDMVIDFKHFFTISTEAMYDNLSHRIFSVEELYREKICQRFAFFQSRIGLPD